jgi:hypothetical protein
MGRMRGVTTMVADWASGEASDLVEPPLNLLFIMNRNLVLHMHSKIFAYTSNTLIAEEWPKTGCWKLNLNRVLESQ